MEQEGTDYRPLEITCPTSRGQCPVILRMEDEGHHWKQGSVSDVGKGQ